MVDPEITNTKMTVIDMHNRGHDLGSHLTPFSPQEKIFYKSVPMTSSKTPEEIPPSSSNNML